MDIIDIINNIQKDNNDKVNLFVNNNNDNLILDGLQQLFPRGIPKGNSMLFYGDTESGKSLFSLNLVNKNKEIMFAYVDTHMQINNSFNNMLLLRTNSRSDIISFFEGIDENLIDVLILDDLSFINTGNEDSRIMDINIFLSDLYRICYSKKIVLILLNTVNGTGNMYMSNSSNILLNSNAIVRLYQTMVNETTITVSGVIEKSKYSNRNNIFLFNAERM